MSSDPGKPAPPLTLGMRVVYSLVFAIALWLLAWIVALVTVLQIVLALTGAGTNADLRRFGAGLAHYAARLIEFLTCASAEPPFPFSDWPGARPGAGPREPDAR